MNYSEQIFKMLSVEPMEEFKFVDAINYKYRFQDDLTIELTDDNKYWRRCNLSILYDILNGDLQIIKKPKPTPEDKIAIEYARLCGCKYLAKDKNGGINGFQDKPFSNEKFWLSSKGLIEIVYPISFLSWEDEEPYYIGSEDSKNE